MVHTFFNTEIDICLEKYALKVFKSTLFAYKSVQFCNAVEKRMTEKKEQHVTFLETSVMYTDKLI